LLELTFKSKSVSPNEIQNLLIVIAKVI